MEYIRPTYAADISYILQASEQLGGGWTDGTEGDLSFTVPEENRVPQDNDTEKVTLKVALTGRVPQSLFFQLTAELENF